MKWHRALVLLLVLRLCVYTLPVHEAPWGPKYRETEERLHRRADHEAEITGVRRYLTDMSLQANKPRCGVPDYPVHSERQRRFVIFGERWDKTELTYRIVRPPKQMSMEKFQQVLKDAHQIWTDVTPIQLTEVSDGRADININFARYTHGDNLPFDGPGGILAHAFFPKTQRAGDIHFDFDEDWTLGNALGTDLLQVAAHEFGHVLGLQHSMTEGAIMSPYYNFTYPLRLSDDDRRGIQYLYGRRQDVTTSQATAVLKTTPSTTTSPSPPPPLQRDPIETNEIDEHIPNACATSFDAASMIRGDLFFFKAGYMWRMRNGQLQTGYPALASRHWRGIPQNIDAAFEDMSGNIWFFKDQYCWVYDGETRISGPTPLHSLGLPVSNVQAALLWDRDEDHRGCFFTSEGFWHFNLVENRVENREPTNAPHWRDIPGDIDDAFQDRDGYVYFLSGLQYWKFDPAHASPMKGFPHSIGKDFFSC